MKPTAPSMEHVLHMIRQCIERAVLVREAEQAGGKIKDDRSYTINLNENDVLRFTIERRKD